MQISAVSVLRKIYHQWRYDLILLHIFILFLDTLTKKSMNIYSIYTVSARQVQAGQRTISSCLGCKASKYFKVLGIETSWAMCCNMWHYVSITVFWKKDPDKHIKQPQKPIRTPSGSLPPTIEWIDPGGQDLNLRFLHDMILWQSSMKSMSRLVTIPKNLQRLLEVRK